MKLIDSAIETSFEIREILKTLDLQSEGQNGRSRKFYVTDSTDRFLRVGERFLGQKIEHIEQVALGG